MMDLPPLDNTRTFILQCGSGNMYRLENIPFDDLARCIRQGKIMATVFDMGRAKHCYLNLATVESFWPET